MHSHYFGGLAFRRQAITERAQLIRHSSLPLARLQHTLAQSSFAQPWTKMLLFCDSTAKGKKANPDTDYVRAKRMRLKT